MYYWNTKEGIYIEKICIYLVGVHLLMYQNNFSEYLKKYIST
jgi:hypothetical protein